MVGSGSEAGARRRGGTPFGGLGLARQALKLREETVRSPPPLSPQTPPSLPPQLTHSQETERDAARPRSKFAVAATREGRGRE